MRYEVKVGSTFVCHVAGEGAAGVIVNVTQNLAPQAAEATGKARPLYVVIAAIVVLAVSATLATTAYGYATGDYGPLKSMAESSASLLQAGAKLVK